MQIICSGRSSGKTINLIKQAAEDNSYTVCYSMQESSRISNLAQDMGLDINFPITIHEFIEGRFHGVGIKSFAIDNAEDILYRLARGVDISCITLNLEENAQERKLEGRSSGNV